MGVKVRARRRSSGSSGGGRKPGGKMAAVPFTSGYVSKSLISTAIDQSGPELASHVLAFASAAAMVYVGLRFPWFVFFARPATANTQTRQEAPLNMQIAMALLAIAICLRLNRACAMCSLPVPRQLP